MSALALELYEEPSYFDKIISSLISTDGSILDLSRQGLKEIPEELQKYKQITWLNLSQNQLSTIPDWFYELKNLTFIDLGHNTFDDIPLRLFAMTNLLRLDINNNKLSKMRYWSVENHSLKILDLSYNKLKTIPENIRSLSSLSRLNLKGNFLGSIPRWFNELYSLNAINLSNNKFGKFPQIKGLFNLEGIDLSGNRISKIPDWIIEFKNLKRLGLNRNKIDYFPIELGFLLNLEQIGLRSNLLTEISQECNNINIRSIDFAENPISKIPEWFNLLSELRELDISFTVISDLAFLSSLSKLKKIDASSTQISDLDPLKNLIQLEILNISSTQISDLEPLKKLTRLERLNISNTKISDLTPLSTLVKLIELDISSTDVYNLSAIRNLNKMKWFHAFNCLIENIEAFQDFQDIEVLDIANTKVSSLYPIKYIIENGISVKLDSKITGQGIYVIGSPLDIPSDFIKQGNRAILNYWNQIEEQGGVEEINEARLIIVGEGATGKTTLFEKLINPKYSPLTNPSQETHGILIYEGLEIAHKFRKDKTLKVNIWDFGGQELQYMTHQFFLSPRALYVLMMDSRKESPNLSYWFKIISLLGKEDKSNEKVRVILVFNKRGNSTGTPHYQDILEHYKNELDTKFVEVDFGKNDHRWDFLKSTIEQELWDLPIVKNKLPKQWKPIREVLRENSTHKPYISTERLAEICTNPPFSINLEKDQFELTSYLHQLGSVLHFQDDVDLMSDVFLSPQWMVEGVYTFLKSEQIKETQKGKFSENDLFHILRGKGYSRIESQKILKLMSKNNFDIC